MAEPGRPKGQPKTGGRVKGTPNKLSASVKTMILGALNELGGTQYLVEQGRANPSAFLSLVGRVLPMQVDGRVELDVDVNVLAREAQLIDAAFSGLHMQGPKLIDAMAIELPESGDGREESNTDRRSTLEHVLNGNRAELARAGHRDLLQHDYAGGRAGGRECTPG